MEDADRQEMELLNPDELRNVAGFLPELNGLTFWHLDNACDYCQQELGEEFLAIQKIGRNGLSLMCIACVRRLFSFSSKPANE